MKKLMALTLTVIMLLSVFSVNLSAAKETKPNGAHPKGPAYFISPDGDDANNGRSRNHPWKTFAHAIPQLQPGDTLVLLDGVYERETTGYLTIDCSKPSGFESGVDGSTEPGVQEEAWRSGLTGYEAVHGTSEAPITVIAQNERQAWIKGDGSVLPLSLYRCANWDLEGLHVSSADHADPEFWAGNAVRLQEASHIELRRLIVDHNNRYLNGGLLYIATSHDVLIEETEVYYFHRNGIEPYQSDNVVVRRSYMNSRGHEDIPGGYASHAISRDGGDGSSSMYYTANSIVENSISENKNEGFSLGISGTSTVLGNPAAVNNKVLGSISINDNKPGGLGESRIRSNFDDSRPSDNLYMENVLLLDSIRRGMVSRASKGVTAKNITAINISDDSGVGVIHINAQRQKSGNTTWPSCEEIGGCQFDLSNMLFLDNPGAAITTSGGEFDWVLHNSNFWNNGSIGQDEPIGDEEGHIRASQSVEPTGVGLAENACAVYIPEDSNMKGAGANGEDIGANILYRYQDGVLTDTPLWDPATGEFPHGAIVEGLNDVPGDSLFDVHERLNVNTNGCMLPYSQ